MADQDREALGAMVADGVVFNGPATAYEGRELVVDVLAIGGGVLRGLAASREPATIGPGETLTLIEASVEGEELKGFLFERANDDGRIAEVTILLRPLGTLQTAVRYIARGIAEGGQTAVRGAPFPRTERRIHEASAREGATSARTSELLPAIAGGDREALDSLIADDVVFHSPVQSYRGREQVLRLLVTIGGVIDDVQATRQLDGVTFFTAGVEEHPVDGVLDEHAGEDGRIDELTLMLRPLAQRQAAMARMARALAGGA